MSSIITNILRSAMGLLRDKDRDSVADILRDGDLADEELREIIVKNLTDIRLKLDCLSLKDLDASYSFLKEGVELLNLALDKSNEDQKASEGSPDEATRVMNDTASGILNAALSLPQAAQRLKISSDKRFISAQDCLKVSREKATDAFNNKSLSIKDRIMACKLRVAARILELGLEDSEAATTACLLSLKELHGLPVIQEMFAVFLKGGLKSMLKKAERLENIKSVLLINHALYNFASKFCGGSGYQFTWPEIELKDRTFHPILDAHEIFTKTSTSDETFVQRLNRVFVDSWVLGRMSPMLSEDPTVKPLNAEGSYYKNPTLQANVTNAQISDTKEKCSPHKNEQQKGALEALEDELVRVKAECDSVTTERDAVRGHLVTVKAERDNARGQLVTVKAERENARGQLVTVKAGRDDATTECDAARSELVTIKAELNATRGELVNVQVQRDAARGELVTVQAELDAAKGRLVTVQAERHATRGELVTVEVERNNARGRLVAVQEERDAAKSKLVKVQAERDAARSELVTVQAERDTLRTECNNLRTYSYYLQHLVAELQRREQNAVIVQDDLRQIVDGLLYGQPPATNVDGLLYGQPPATNDITALRAEIVPNFNRWPA